MEETIKVATIRLPRHATGVFVITDANLTWPDEGDHLFVISPGETSKSLATAESIYTWLYTNKATRSSTLVGFGGGVVLDIAGFVAATYCRGMRFVSIPTTLLAMVDAAVGGKNGLNFGEMKNGIGTFYDPDELRIDVRHLLTLPEREYRSGMAECVKYGAIADSDLFDWLDASYEAWERRDLDFLERLVDWCLSIKREIVAEDRLDKGRRHLLNFGHTVGHAVEVLSNYTISHGEAVAIGLVAESGSERIQRLLERYGFDTRLPYPMEALKEVMQRDKKEGHNPQFIEVGTCILP